MVQTGNEKHIFKGTLIPSDVRLSRILTDQNANPKADSRSWVLPSLLRLLLLTALLTLLTPSELSSDYSSGVAELVAVSR